MPNDEICSTQPPEGSNQELPRQVFNTPGVLQDDTCGTPGIQTRHPADLRCAG